LVSFYLIKVNGTLEWFENRLRILKNKNPKSIVIFQHHPFNAPWYVPTTIYGFSSDKQNTLKNLYLKYFEKNKFFGVIGGHWHR
jgi:hypothetical protein